jgi:hypothetical protein
MGSFTYRLFQDVTLEELKAKTEANLALYEPSSKGAQVKVTGFQGDGCSAILIGFMLHEDEILRPVAFQFGGIWMDVRYQDGATFRPTAQPSRHAPPPLSLRSAGISTRTR